MVRTVPTSETKRDRAKAAVVGSVMQEIMQAVRARGGLIEKPEIMFHWRLRKPIRVWRDKVTGRFKKTPPEWRKE